MSSPGSLALADITVIDLTTFLSGPYATQILGDLGAEVIKVETPRGGDPTRLLPPHFVHGDSAYFHSVNRNKKSVVIDLKNADGVDVLLKLVAKADVLIDNFRPGVMDRLNLSGDRLREINPRLVWCSLTGFGPEGPYKNHPAYDMIVQALSGGMSLTGERDGHSVRSGIPLGDLAAGMFSVIGILAALNERHATGKGRRVDVAMLDCQISMLCYQAQYNLVSGQVPGRQGAGHDSIPTYRSFLCSDGKEIVITANSERMWTALCDVLERPDLSADPRFATNKDRFENRLDLWPLLEVEIGRHGSTDLLPRLNEASVPSAPVKDVAQALSDPQVLSRDMVVDATAPDGRSLRMVGNPVRLLGDGTQRYEHPPRLGEHTQDVLSGLLGLDEAEIAALMRSGAVASPSAFVTENGA